MLSLEQIVSKLQDRRPMMICEATGIEHRTVANIRDGKVTNPSLRVVQLLSDYLEGKNNVTK